MFVSSRTTLNLWGETIFSMSHIQSRMPYKKIGKTPYELWKGHAPNIPQHVGVLCKGSLRSTEEMKIRS